MNEIIQLKIALKGTKPPIWRRVLVNKNISFQQLHNIIQIAMGWQNYHLFEFDVNNERIGQPDNEFDLYSDSEVVDASSVTLESVITKPKEKFDYEYDFGDGWDHQILVEDFLPADKTMKYPACIKGRLNCPPEDCGGIGGFYHLLEILNSNDHPEKEFMQEWIGESYDPKHFDIDEVNDELHSLD